MKTDRENELVVKLSFVLPTTAKSMSAEEVGKIVGAMITDFGRDYLERADTRFNSYELFNKLKKQ